MENEKTQTKTRKPRAKKAETAEQEVAEVKTETSQVETVPASEQVPPQSETASVGAQMPPPNGYGSYYNGGQVPPPNGYNPYMYGQAPAPNGYYMPNQQMPQTYAPVQPVTGKKNILSLLGFIGYFVSCFSLLMAFLMESPVIGLFGIATLVASLVLSIIGFVKRKNYAKQNIAVTALTLTINFMGMLLIVFLYLFFFAS